MKKRIWIWLIPVSVAALVTAAALLLPGGDSPGPGTGQTHPPSAGTVQKPPVQPGVPDRTEPPETTDPGEVQPPETTEPPQTPTDGPEQTQPRYPESEPTEPPVYDTVEFPVELEGGRLTVESLFQFSGMNPDAGLAFGEEIAGLQITNTSDEYLYEAELAAVLADGRVLTFLAQDVPPGKTVMAFCLEHEPVPVPDACEDIYGTVEFGPGADVVGTLVQVSVSGTEITLTNLTDRKLTDLNVICHGVLDDSYYGGKTYSYTVATLPAYGSTVVHAVDCILGMAEVARVEADG